MPIFRKANWRLRLWSLLAGIPLLLVFGWILATTLLRGKMIVDEENAPRDVRVLEIAEASYAANNPRVGFTCDLSALTDLIGSRLAGGQVVGYVFEVRNCKSDRGGGPNSKFQVTATPMSCEAGKEAFCSDESGVVRSDRNGRRKRVLIKVYR